MSDSPYLNTAELQQRWRAKDPDTITALARAGRIPGAFKRGSTWLYPREGLVLLPDENSRGENPPGSAAPARRRPTRPGPAAGQAAAESRKNRWAAFRTEMRAKLDN